MSKFIECSGYTELEEKSDELYDVFSHVEFVGWHENGTVAEFFCV